MIGNTYSTQVPMNIAPGDYLVRHEIIALQLATVEGGVEFYPSCTQIRVSSNGTGESQSTVAFPGGYSSTEPGILDPNVRCFSSQSKFYILTVFYVRRSSILAHHTLSLGPTLIQLFTPEVSPSQAQRHLQPVFLTHLLPRHPLSHHLPLNSHR